MSTSPRKITWESAKGAIYLDGDAGRERVILTRKGFMEAFFSEIEKVGGKDALTMVFRSLLTKLGASGTILDHPTLPDVTRFHDGLIIPYRCVEENMPPAFTPVPDSRELTAYGDTVFTFQKVALLQRFKEAMTEILTDRGAVAILHRIAKQGGFTVASKALTDYSWKELDPAMNSMDQVLGSVFPLYGWGISRTATGRGADGRRHFYLKCGNIYEMEGMTSERPLCIVHQSYLEGIGECLSQTYEHKAVESREVKCRAMGDKYCAFFIVQKEADEKGVEWKTLEEDWKKIDAALPDPGA